jgi:hypothetical protein
LISVSSLIDTELLLLLHRTIGSIDTALPAARLADQSRRIELISILKTTRNLQLLKQLTNDQWNERTKQPIHSSMDSSYSGLLFSLHLHDTHE